jgi:hypothetical protein
MNTGQEQYAKMELFPCVKFGKHSDILCIYLLSVVRPAVFTKVPVIMYTVPTNGKAI